MKTFSVMVFILAGIAKSSPFPYTNSAYWFELTASGGENGIVGQLNNGQTRIGGGLSPSTFCITGLGIRDSEGRKYIITDKFTLQSIQLWLMTSPEPQTQWQYDSGKTPFPSFNISCRGVLSYEGSSTFWECQTGDNGETNIYTTPRGAVCCPITLNADNCITCCWNWKREV